MKFLSLFLIIFTTSTSLLGQVKQGEIDVSSINFNKEEIVDLSGSWNFYWKQVPFDESGSYRKLNSSKQQVFEVPGSWGQLEKPAFGYGTMHVRIKGVNSRKLELSIPDIRSCHEVWCNGRKIFGTPNKTFDPVDAGLRLKPLRVSLPKADSLDLYLVLSNYDFQNHGRVSSEISLMSSVKARELEKEAVMSSALITSFLLSFCLFALTLYFFGIRRDRRILFLYFSVICLAAAVRQASLHTNLFWIAFEDLSSHIVYALRFGSAYAAVGFGILYFKSLFPEEANQRLTKVLAFTCFAAILILFITPVSISSYLLVPMIVVMILSTAYGVFVMARAWMKKRMFAAVSLISIVLLLFGFLNDTLVSYNVIESYYLTTYVSSGLLLINLVIIVSLFKKFEKEAIVLSERIVHKNKDIEQLAVDQVSLGDKQRKIIQDLELALDAPETDKQSLKRILQDWKYHSRISERSSFEAQNLDRINSEFISALKQQYPKLSSTEIEICTFVRINMSNKEIAAYRGTTEDAVRVAKARIRKKMELDKEVVLEDVLLDLTNQI